MFLIHCCLSPSDVTLNSTKLFCFKTYPYLYGKTFWLVSFFIFTILITSFSQYTTICFVSFVYSVFNEHFFKCRIQNAECKMNSTGGDDGIRTHDPLLAGQVLSQLSYTPIIDCIMLNAECRIIRFCCSPFQPSRSEDFTFRLVEKFHSFTNFTFDEVKNFIASFSLLGRPKWTRTTDLVLIRHAL